MFTSLLNYRHRNAENPTQWSDAAGVRAIATRAHTNYPIALSVDDSDDSFALRIQTEERIDPRRILGYIITSMQAALVLPLIMSGMIDASATQRFWMPWTRRSGPTTASGPVPMRQLPTG